DLACVKAGITDAMDLKKWVPETVEDAPRENSDDADPDKPTRVAYKNKAEASRAIGNLTEDDDEAAYIVAVRCGLSDFDAGVLAGLKRDWAKRSGCAKSLWDKGLREGKKQ